MTNNRGGSHLNRSQEVIKGNNKSMAILGNGFSIGEKIQIMSDRSRHIIQRQLSQDRLKNGTDIKNSKNNTPNLN